MITVHHLENSRSHSTLWLLEELGAEYEIELYKRDPVTRLAPASLKDVHPLGKSPVITDGDITVAESGTIVEYLMRHYSQGQLQPADNEQARIDYSYFLHYAEGTMMPLMIINLLLSRVESAKMPFFIKPIATGITGKLREAYLTPNTQMNLNFLEERLNGRQWFTGDTLTAADIHMSFMLEGLSIGGTLDNLPNLKSCHERGKQRPAYQRAVERGGPLDLAAMRRS
ncbi:MAG: glutathione S-transferase [Pseudomonadota bacterium]